jgi:hypothetical protein
MWVSARALSSASPTVPTLGPAFRSCLGALGGEYAG